MLRHSSRCYGAQSLLLSAAIALGVTFAALVFVMMTPGVSAGRAEEPSATPSTSAGPGEEGDPNLGPPTPGTATCTVSNTALTLISGMVATDKGILAVEGRDTDALRIFTVDDSCKVTTKTYSGANPLDPQDLALGSDGTLWVGDIGPGESTRATVAVWKIPAGGSSATIYRMNYPKTGPFNAEALLLDKDDVPIIISSEGGKGLLYRPSKELVPSTQSNLPVLEKVGEFTPQKTGTENPAKIVGNAAVTGAAKSPDGSKVVIRTASDAYEFAIGEDGDIIKAITEGTPVVTRLPNEPNGKAITYSADGATFLTLSATSKPQLLSYTPFVPEPEDTGGEPNENLPDAPSGQSWLSKLSFSELTRIVAAVGVVGLVLAIAGIVGIRRARRRRREEEEYDYDDYDEPVRSRRGRGRRGEHGYGMRGPGYAEGYDEQYGYADAGYNGYGGGGYAEAGYGQNGYGTGGYGSSGYGGAQPAYDPYAGQTQYGGGDYGGGQYEAQQYGGSGDYGGYGGQQYGGEYGGQSYGGTQQYGGYGYEEEFDPLNDPRRR